MKSKLGVWKGEPGIEEGGVRRVVIADHGKGQRFEQVGWDGEGKGEERNKSEEAVEGKFEEAAK